MVYAYSKIIGDKVLEFARDPLMVLTCELDDIALQLHRSMPLSDYLETVTQIRPFPRFEGESSANGYDRLRPRMGIQIVMTAK